jgi:hypothetical protein
LLLLLLVQLLLLLLLRLLVLVLRLVLLLRRWWFLHLAHHAPSEHRQFDERRLLRSVHIRMRVRERLAHEQLGDTAEAAAAGDGMVRMVSRMQKETLGRTNRAF